MAFPKRFRQRRRFRYASVTTLRSSNPAAETPDVRLGLFLALIGQRSSQLFENQWVVRDLDQDWKAFRDLGTVLR
ncbi:MAG: hypothetical protein HY719_17680 [Planctomycetes bacterium]|nr:hypothetical protein [Planctomycetota bacterium]